MPLEPRRAARVFSSCPSSPFLLKWGPGGGIQAGTCLSFLAAFGTFSQESHQPALDLGGGTVPKTSQSFNHKPFQPRFLGPAHT